MGSTLYVDPIPIETPTDTSLAVSGQGTGGFFPSPQENRIAPYQGEVLGLLHDGEGCTRIRGAVLTDEGNIRDDFPGTTISSDLTGTLTFTKDSVIVSGTGTSFKDEVSKDWYVKFASDPDTCFALVSRLDTAGNIVLEEPYTGDGGIGAGKRCKWIPVREDGTLTVADSILTIKTDLTASGKAGVYRDGDYCPCTLVAIMSIAYREDGQAVVLGFTDTLYGQNYEDTSCILFEGSDNRKLKLLTACEGATEETEITLPYGQTTEEEHQYDIEMTSRSVSLFIDRVKAAVHSKHIPRPYTEMYYGCAVWNDGVPADEGEVHLDSIFFSNYDTINVENAAKGSPITISSTIDNEITAYIKKAVNPKIPFISPNWCDKTTWYAGSTYVSNETATDSGDHTTYTLAHTNVIDTYHGKITFEDALTDSDGRSYRAVVKVNGTAKTEQDPHYGTGGDYTIDYAAGTVTFLSALQANDVVTVSYHYADTVIMTVAPLTGYKLIIESVELHITEDAVMNDSCRFQAYGLVECFAPQLMQPPYSIPEGTKIPIGDPLVYKTIVDLINDSNKSYPSYPALGASNWRGSPEPIHKFIWDYDEGVTELYAKYGMEIRLSLDHNEPCGGTSVTVTLHCTRSEE